ncbi:MAG: hypothetical protein JW888_14335 [Pirellulales bacterium]|nr:hypothetical protein [Pirellulales bacterium]
MLLLVCLLAGCTPFHNSGERRLTVANYQSQQTSLSPSKAGDVPDASSVRGKAPKSNRRAPEKLTQEAATALAASEPSRWDSVLKDLSTVVHAAGASGNKKTLVPDPTEPRPTGPVIDHERHDAGGNEDPISNAFQTEVVSTPDASTPVTLNLNEASARQALEMLDSSNPSVNILIASGVSGNVTANLRGMSFDEALNAILRLCNLVVHREGRNIFVYTPDDLPQLDLTCKVIPVDYVSAEEVVDSITTMKGLLSSKGSAYAFITDDPAKASEDDPDGSDNRKSREAVVVTDALDHVLRVERYLREIDVPPHQVQIQAYILSVDLKDNLKHGVNFEEIIQIAGNTATLQTVGFAATNASQAFLAKIDGHNFDALVESLKTTTDAKTLADPKITVLNGQLAHIQIGEKLGYLDTTTQTSEAATQSVKFLELGVVLDVTPRISATNEVTMTVKPKVSSGRINPVTKMPEEETTELTTNVRLQNGQGMVIGGLIKEKDSDIQKKIPFLGNLPYVGMLFQDRTRETERKEVIIAILPRVLPYTGCPAARERLETIRATTPLFHGPLRRCPRPWEPSLRDALPERGDRL